MLTDAACTRLLTETARFSAWLEGQGRPRPQPNSMNRHGVVLDDCGLAAGLARFVERRLRPLAAARFPDLGGATLDGHHAFSVEYALDGDTELGFHADDAEVTLNVCLGEDFAGGALSFRGLRCPGHLQDHERPDEVFELEHVPGVGVLHAGLHRHLARPLRAGRRVNLVIWCRSSSLRAERRRAGGSCGPFCGARPAR